MQQGVFWLVPMGCEDTSLPTKRDVRKRCERKEMPRKRFANRKKVSEKRFQEKEISREKILSQGIIETRKLARRKTCLLQGGSGARRVSNITSCQHRLFSRERQPEKERSESCHNRVLLEGGYAAIPAGSPFCSVRFLLGPTLRKLLRSSGIQSACTLRVCTCEHKK